VVGYQQFRGPCSLQGEVTDGKERHRYRPGAQVGGRDH